MKEAAEALAKAALENSSPPELKQIAASTQSTADRLLSMEAKMESMERFAVTQNLQWAIQHCLTGQSKSGFSFYDGKAKISSNETVTGCLYSFNGGLALWISVQYFIGSNDEYDEKGYQA